MQRNSTHASGSSDRQPEDLFQHLLVGVGGSARSLQALRYALEIARRTSVNVESLIVEDFIVSCGMLVGHGDALRHFMEEAERLATLAGNRTAQQIEQTAREIGYPVSIERAQGRVTDCMVEASNRASLLVLGKLGHRSDHGGLLGTNTELIIRRSHKPVLLTPEHYVWPHRVIVAYGGKSLDDAVLRTGIDCSRALDLPITVITVERDPARCSSLWENARNQFPELQTAAFEHDAGDASSAIVCRTAEHTLLVMGAYGRSKLYHMVLGSVTTAVMRAARGLVLLTAKKKQDATQ